MIMKVKPIHIVSLVLMILIAAILLLKQVLTSPKYQLILIPAMMFSQMVIIQTRADQVFLQVMDVLLTKILPLLILIRICILLDRCKSIDSTSSTSRSCKGSSFKTDTMPQITYLNHRH